MHKEVREFCKYVKKLNPHYFRFKNVVDFGSLDINGNNRHLFNFCTYTGVDLIPGYNVDVVIDACMYGPQKPVSVIISTEMLEHDLNWKISIANMYDILNPRGLLLLTFATEGRKEHGTFEHKPKDSPATNNYYHNITFEEFKNIISKYDFSFYEIKVNSNGDMMFWGIKT